MNSALVVIDVQEAILKGLPAHNPAQVETQFSILLDNLNTLRAVARRHEVPIIYVQHDGDPGHRLEVNTPGWAIHHEIAPVANELIVHKRASDSFFETCLEQELRARQIDHLVIAGCMTQWCVDTTCRRAVTLDFDVTLVENGHTTCDNEFLTVHQIIAHHNRLLNGFGAGGRTITVKPTSEIRFV